MAVEIDVPYLLERLGIRYERRGRELWARCPMPDHEERTASWHIRDEPDTDKHGRHHCHGCEVGGSAVFLVMKLLDMGGKEAWSWIRSDAAIVQRPPKLHTSVDVLAPSELGRFRLPFGAIVGQPLEEWPERPRSYLLGRGVTEWQIKRWALGYAIDGRLRGRIVIPVLNGRNRLISYTARAFVRSDRKYLEPKEVEGADKAAVFGEEWWPENRSTLLVFEGAFNALAGERSTKLPVAALQGSQFLPGHAARLSMFPEIVIASDPDKAGVKLAAAVRSLGRWCKVRFASFPEGLDANDVERQHGPRELARVLGVEPADGDRNDVAAR